MGGSLPAAYEYWKRVVNEDGSYFGIVKTDHVSKLGSVQQMSYQMVNSLPCSRLDVKNFAATSIGYVENLKTDPDAFNRFLKQHSTAVNHYEMLSVLYEHNPEIAKSDWFRREKRVIINAYVNRLRSGKITVEGDNLTMCGSPYALLLYAVGEDWQQDPTLRPEDGTIQCYTKRFNDGEYIAGFRSPCNSPDNNVYLHNTKHELMDRYFDFSENIIAVNCIETDVQARLNGADFDSDFIFTTNQPTIVACAQTCYLQYPTIVNALRESGLSYDNSPDEYAKLDTILAKSRRGIGESSNLAQLALSYYWTKPEQELYDNFVILSVLAQIIIDSSKRMYEVDAIAEIDRIKKSPAMKREKDFPEFMKYTRPIEVTKNGKELPYEDIVMQKNAIKCRIDRTLTCPMNHLQEWLDKIQGASQVNAIPISDFLIRIPGKPKYKQITKIMEIIAKFEDYTRQFLAKPDSIEAVEEYFREYDSFIDKVRMIKIGNPVTINRMILSAMSVDEANNLARSQMAAHSRKVLNCLFKTNREKFLMSFVQKTGEN